LFNLSIALLCVAGLDGYFKRVNPAFEATLGHSQDELLATPFVDFVHPEDREKTLLEIRKLVAGTPTVYFENRYRCRNGSYRWLAWTATPQEAEGLIYATALDITESKRAHERFRLLLETAPDAMVIVDDHGEIVLVNAPAEKMFGYAREELIGRPVEILMPNHLRDGHLDHRRSFLASPQPRPMGSGVEIHARRKDGSTFPADISLSVLRTENETLVSSAIRDLSEQKRIADVMLENTSQLLAAQRIQEHFLPKAPPAIPGLDIAGAVFPAEFAAGDHFDFLQMPNGSLGLVVSDVCGHGFASALLMASTQTILRALAQQHDDISEILGLASRFLFEESEDNRFVTVFLGCLDPVSRTLVHASAGHPTGYVFDSSGGIKASLESTSPPLGMTPDGGFPVAAPVLLEPGDILLLLTDGLLEALAPNGASFDVERTLEVVRSNRTRSARDIVDALHHAVCKFSDCTKLADDITLLVVKVEA
jgi:PAS domain S-box-containing protein